MKSSGKACCLIYDWTCHPISGSTFLILAFLAWRFQIDPLTWFSGANQSSTLASRVIDAAQGGHVEFANGIQVDIPPKSLGSNASVHASILTTPPKEVFVPQYSPAIFHEINIGGVALKQPVKLTLSYANLETSSPLDPNLLFVARWENGAWTYLGGEVDTERKTITVATEHFSPFGIFSLPSIDSLLTQFENYFSKCDLPPGNLKNDQWTQLINQIGQRMRRKSRNQYQE